MRASIEAGEALRRVLSGGAWRAWRGGGHAGGGGGWGVFGGGGAGGGPGRGRLWMREPGGGALVRYEEVALIGGIEEED